MRRAPVPEDDPRRATLGFLRSPHLRRGGDEDLHPSRLDPAERALRQFEEWKEEKRARRRP